MARLSRNGRRRTPIWMIQGADAQQVAFSGHRSGLYEVAGELYTLCFVEAVLAVFFPDGKAFTFGPPGILIIMNRLSDHDKPNFDAMRHGKEQEEATLYRINKDHSDLHEKREAEKSRVDRIIEMILQSQSEDLVNRAVAELNREEMLTLKSLVEQIMEKLRERMQAVKRAASTPISAGESNAFLSGSTEGGSAADPDNRDVGHEH
ncbi:hypothetical protein DITRI_Ditri18aG0075500 [Diplodiscus trichospermus]